jgi:hypothetical protein
MVPPKPERPLDKYVRFSGAGIQMGVIITAGALGGQYLDEKLNFAIPWMTVLGSLLGVGLAIYFLIRELNRIK